MKQNGMHGIRVASSDHKERMQELRENHKRLEEMLANGWKIESARKKRSRIKKEKTPRKVEISIAGGWIKMIVEYPDWVEHGSLGTVIRKFD